MTSLLVGSKSFSFKHKNFQKQTTSFSAEDFPFHVCLWLTTIRVTVVHPLPKPLQVTLNYIAQKTAIHTLKQIWLLSPQPLPVLLWHPQPSSLDKKPLPLRCRNWQRLTTAALLLPKPQRRGSGLGCSSFLSFFINLQSLISLKHHHSKLPNVSHVSKKLHISWVFVWFTLVHLGIQVKT